MTVYSEAFKAKMIQKMCGPNAQSATALSSKVNIPQSTLSNWLRHSRTVTTDDDKKPAPSPPARSAQDKLRIVLEFDKLAEPERGALLRREGLYEVEVAQWRASMLEALEGPSRRASSRDDKRVKELEREVRRKDKALAEAAALLMLQKKVQQLWGDEDDGTDEGSGR